MSHQGVDAQQAIVYLDLELQGTVVNVISRREVSTRGSKQEIAPVLGDKGIKLANRFVCVHGIGVVHGVFFNNYNQLLLMIIRHFNLTAFINIRITWGPNGLFWIFVKEIKEI